MAAMTLDISNVTRKYKSEQKFFSQWVMKTVADLDIPCTTDIIRTASHALSPAYMSSDG